MLIQKRDFEIVVYTMPRQLIVQPNCKNYTSCIISNRKYTAKDLFKLYHRVDDLKKAYNWAKQLLLCDLNRFDDGIREFYFGKINYDLGATEVAKEYLTVAKKKSRNRCFIIEDKKYKQLV